MKNTSSRLPGGLHRRSTDNQELQIFPTAIRSSLKRLTVGRQLTQEFLPLFLNGAWQSRV